MATGTALVLMYHQIVPDEASAGWVPGALADPRYGVRLSRFRAQMDLIVSRGMRVISLVDLIESRLPSSSSGPSVVLTFDDGYGSDWHFAAPILKERGFPATFFLATDHLGLSGMMTPEDARVLASNPLFTLGSHGGSHRFLPDLPPRERLEEFARSREAIRLLSGKDPVDLSAPGGRISETVRKDARDAGFRSLSTSKPGIFETGTDPFSIPRLPVLHRHSLPAFEALLDPDSIAFRVDAAVRLGKNALRAMARIRNRTAGKGAR